MSDLTLGMQYHTAKTTKLNLFHRHSFWNHFRINSEFDPNYDIPIQGVLQARYF